MSELIPRHILIDPDEGVCGDAPYDRPRLTALDHVLQAAILLISPLLMFVLAMPDPATARWGFVLGLALQPVWVVTAWRAGQWGVLFNALAWAVAFAWGIHNHFTF